MGGAGGFIWCGFTMCGGGGSEVGVRKSKKDVGRYPIGTRLLVCQDHYLIAGDLHCALASSRSETW